MIKKIIIVVVVAVIGYFGYGFMTHRSHSPLTSVEGNLGELSVSVDYCQPSKKGRLIFGEESEDALVPNGQYWRLGANDATEITFNKDVNFAGKNVAAGRYRFYAVPDATQWELSLNSQIGEFGFFEPDYTLDVVKVNVPVQSNSEELELFTMTFDSDSTGLQLNMAWDQTLVSVPISQQ